MIVLYIPAYVSSSNGIRIWYTFAELCHKSNIQVRIVCYEQRRNDHSTPSHFSDEISIQYAGEGDITISDADIVFYPETIRDNPLHAKHCVRYLLNNPGVLTGKAISYGLSDYIVVYSNLIAPLFAMHQCFIVNDDIEEISIFRDVVKKNKCVFYFGKINRRRVVRKFRDATEISKSYDEVDFITRAIPASRQAALKSIAESRLMISFDPLSNMNYEATLLGTPVILMDDSYDSMRFNMGSYGLYAGNEVKSVSEQRDDRAWNSYWQKIQMQEKDVTNLLFAVKQHFDTIDQVWRYRMAVRINNALRAVYDWFIATIKYAAIKYSNVNTYEDLPPYIYLCIQNSRPNMKLITKREYTKLYLQRRMYRWFKNSKILYFLAYPIRKIYKRLK